MVRAHKVVQQNVKRDKKNIGKPPGFEEAVERLDGLVVRAQLVLDMADDQFTMAHELREQGLALQKLVADTRKHFGLP